jgi:hypothetical protein
MRAYHFRLLRQRTLALGLFLGGMGWVGSACAILLDRGPDLVYDTVLNITWTRNANLSGTTFNWTAANTWAANLVFGGFDDWRLPWASVIAGPGPTPVVYTCTGAGGADEVACRDNEMGYMFYYNLNGNLGANLTGNRTAVGGEMLTNIQLHYWSGTELNSFFARDFRFLDGSQFVAFKDLQRSAWAVRPGDLIAAAPEPASLLLIGVGRAGLGFRRRKRAA